MSALTCFCWRADASGFNRLESLETAAGKLAEPPWWLDVSPTLAASDLVATLAPLDDDINLGHDVAKALLGGKDRPKPQDAHLCRHNDMLRFWAFGATVEREDGPDGASRAVAISLQPVGLLVSRRVVVTCRHTGTRFPLGDTTNGPSPSPHLDCDQLRTSTQSSLISLLRSAPGFNSDALLFALLTGLVNTLFEARAALGSTKILCDEEYFARIIRLRREAAISNVGSEDVARVAQEATRVIDHTRRTLSSIQRILVPFRQWFNDLKPPGLPDKSTVWLPNTSHRAASEYLVDRIYQVRNDLQAVRREVHQSMGLLATADTGSQLLAVRALLDRTESARNAVVVAGTITVLLAVAGLSTALASIPSSGARIGPLERALGYAGITVMTIVVVGVAVALLSRLPTPTSRRVWLVLSGTFFCGALVLLAVAAAGTGSTDPVFVGGGVGSAVASLLAAAYGGDFGPRRSRPILTSAIGALLENRDEWSGTLSELANSLRAADEASHGRMSLHLRRKLAVNRAAGNWCREPASLEANLLDEQLPLHHAGLEVQFYAHERVMILKSEESRVRCLGV